MQHNGGMTRNHYHSLYVPHPQKLRLRTLDELYQWTDSLEDTV